MERESEIRYFRQRRQGKRVELGMQVAAAAVAADETDDGGLLLGSHGIHAAGGRPESTWALGASQQLGFDRTPGDLTGAGLESAEIFGPGLRHRRRVLQILLVEGFDV